MNQPKPIRLIFVNHERTICHDHIIFLAVLRVCIMLLKVFIRCNLNELRVKISLLWNFSGDFYLVFASVDSDNGSGLWILFGDQGVDTDSRTQDENILPRLNLNKMERISHHREKCEQKVNIMIIVPKLFHHLLSDLGIVNNMRMLFLLHCNNIEIKLIKPAISWRYIKSIDDF